MLDISRQLKEEQPTNLTAKNRRRTDENNKVLWVLYLSGQPETPQQATKPNYRDDPTNGL